MTTRPFRFGVSLLNAGARSAWHTRVRRAEALGYDALQVPDHLGMVAPFPALVAAAEATSTMTLGTYVLNVGVLSPAYLARDAATVHRLTDGRLELGLGAGYVPSEFEAAGVPLGSAGQRLKKLAETLSATRALLAKEPDQPAPPILLAGAGERMLRLAAREADIVGFSVMAGIAPDATPEEAFAQRVQVLRDAAGARIDDLELNLFVAAVGESTEQVDLSIIRGATGFGDDQLMSLPAALVGSAGEIADRLLRYREQFGISYISVMEPHMEAFAEVIRRLRPEASRRSG